MNLSLHPDLQRFVDNQVEAGTYDSAEALVNAAVERLRTEQELSGDQLKQLRAAVAVGIEQADRGEVAPWDPADLKRRVREATQ